MAIVTDPDILRRYSVVFGAKTQRVSLYPVGDTQRGDAGTYANDAYFANTSTIVRASGAWTASVNGDVVAVLTGDNAGHYYVNNNVSTTTLSLANVDLGTSGAQHDALANNTITFDAVANVEPSTNVITITAHGYVPGEAVVLDAASPPTGLTDGTIYYVIVDDANSIRLATSYSNALAGTGVNITADGTGTANLHERVIISVWNNGASLSEQINGNDTSGDGDGDIADGITLQAIYSFGKEEWRNDVDLLTGGGPDYNYNDDLIKHQFPFEAITSEQFEIGGGTAHDNWNWFNSYSRKKVRTGGWAEKTTVSAVNDLAQETGIVTLGSLDADTQVYYQQTSATTTPTNFTFLGTINEAIRIYFDANQDGTADSDFRTYLKLFARKKGKTYVQSEIADIGVSTIQTIVNRFPLAHATDAAIVNTDAEILGESPWRVNANNDGLTDKIDGAIVSGETVFVDSDTDFLANGIVAGDTLIITAGTADTGRYTIASVDSVSNLTLQTDFEFSGWSESNTGITYEVSSYYRLADKTTTPGTAAVLSTGETTSGSNAFVDSTEDLSVAQVDDILWTQYSGETYGLYKITTVTNANHIVVDDTDQPFTTNNSVEYMILNKGMYLQYKNDLTTTHANSVNGGTVTQVDYDNANATYGNRPTITLTGESWAADIGAGSIVNVSNSSLNDGAYTVFARETAQIVSLVASDVIVDESDTNANSYVTHYEGWKREVGANTYAFNWKVTASGGGLQDIYQYVQHQLRQTTDIDYGVGTARGDITDLLMSYAAPTGTTLNMFPDDLDTNDINNITLQDHSGVNRNFPFTAAGSLVFNTNLSTDTNAKYWLFFSHDDAGDNLGRDYGTKDAIIVKDADGVDIAGSVPQQPGGSSVTFTYDYDGNVQRGSASAGSDAPVTLVCIGLDTAQFVLSTGTISRATGITISAVAALERNYLNA